MTLAERALALKSRPPSHKAAVLAAVLLPAHLMLWWMLHDVWLRQQDAVSRAFERYAAFWLLAAVVLLLLALVSAWRKRPAAWLPFVFAVTYALFIDVGVQLGGAVAISWIPLATLLFAFHFDERVGLTLLVTSLVVSVPLMALDVPWFWGSADLAVTVAALWQRIVAVLVILNLAYCALVLGGQRLLERRLNDANRLIRRYVPAQLADRILAGGHDETARHERRKLTIFFSDVVGFTGLSDELDAEELASLLNEYLGEMTALADRYGATVNQLVGDGIMIFFGAPTATDDRDHALRAVRMAQAMQQRMGELRQQWFNRGVQRPFRIRIGINTGFASVGDFGSPGRMMYSAIGQQTNLAARIQAHCEPDRILLSHPTWALVRDEVPCTARGEIQVKGLHYPVLVYEVADSVVRSAA